MRPSHTAFIHYVRSVSLAAVMILVSALAVPQAARAQATLVVDADGQATAADCNAAQAAYSHIQEAVNAAAPGDTILICPGVYNEQVAVTTSGLTLQGSGVGSTIIRPSAVHVNSVGSFDQFPMAPILLVESTTGVSVKDLTIDGSLADSGASIGLPCLTVGYFTGIFYRHSSGTVEDVHVTQIRSASVCSSGFSGGSDYASVSNVVIKDSVFDNYGGLGLNCVGPNTTCSVTGNTFKGLGLVDDQIQGGVIFRLGAGGEISGNTITDHIFFSNKGGIGVFSVGIALFDAEPDLNPHLLQENIFINNQLNVQRQGTAQLFQ